jgi:hypothetical protein
VVDNKVASLGPSREAGRGFRPGGSASCGGASMTREERLIRGYLKRHICWLCELPLHRDWCGAIGERCSVEVMAARRADCLRHYRPRRRRSNSSNDLSHPRR